MMSLRRLAVIAPLSLMHNKHNNTSNVVNMTTTTTTTATTATSNVQRKSAKESTATTNVDFKQTQTATETTTTIVNNKHNNKHQIIDDVSYTDESAAGNSSDDSNETYTSIINTYADGGNGLQTIRASFGVSGLFGHSPGGISSGGNIGSGHQSYPHAINGNANLLLCGAMLSVVTTILCVVCYCCHRNIKKRTEAAYRQQHQWLESDPNMEIYSVEQSYETSGLFLGESSDGFTTLATLHHEPPPSYDAVVAMQEQQLLQHQLYQQQCRLQQQQQQHQQQQMHLQHSSPPPGYRSTLTVNDMPTPTISASAATSNMAMDTLNNDSNGNLSSSCNISISGNSIGGNSCSNFFACGKPTASANRYNSNSNSAAFFNMKKALNAQSCCSLQRAEVENMWNAAAAAVAVRASHATSSPCGAASLAAGNAAGSSNGSNNNNNSRSHISPMLLARKSLPLPLTLPAKFTAKSGARRYLAHQSTYYRRGCPLCGKFRYDVDDALTLSVESGLDVPTTTSTSTATAAAGRAPASAAANDNDADGETSVCRDLRLGDSCQQLTALDDVVLTEGRGGCERQMAGRGGADALGHERLDKCACVVNILESPTTVIIDSDSNGNNNNSSTVRINGANNLNAQPNELHNETAVESPTVMIDQNANDQTVTEHESLVAAQCMELTENVNVEAITSSNARCASNADTEAAASTVSGDVSLPNSPEDNTLDVLNANSGIIRVDMSKVIDQTGLPTYEAVAKLESSGYV
ncbi:uncharacterized protein LOC120770169 [Bactrocera tryoni]|uniref:uncharacterized protein LOC120770169 n=1 Tax=Bactrocera tryoni TaxID=59916 RepID=UPI001A96BD5E|nr:uncharacterized protein LOC120770169 [Bactrocera tryoni]XP_039953314.1 uncharacterized protein LOC120770169 [Bactrocera tryoni]XP_039953315.1 uncharacterized protein LOC120770169 [Bactrocera tryoni]XP_039953316.1 uncharacterized protein LOC120770169 [Bactrocera tryoni]XP_039953317.1 uncharacterized protein LOC120770169 [Bactrocera tryoni]XP_039953318.1 uncharacterized protein LOC120770169 [Bactrocera tryoni]